jgi:hypothetical protein
MRSKKVKSIGGKNAIRASYRKGGLGCVDVQTWYGDEGKGPGQYLCLAPRQAKALARWFAKYLKEVTP